MRIAKYLHSCLVFEQDGQKLLVDPGTFSFAEGRVQPEQFADVGTILLTHNHPDHIDVPALTRIVALSGARVIGNAEIVAVLAEHGIAVEEHNEGPIQVGPLALRAIPAPHEPILAGRLPQHTAYLIDDRILHSVDSFGTELDAYTGMDLLILPVMAPFLTEVGAFAFAARMQPKAVLPVHDGYARDFFIAARYDAYETFLREPGHRVPPGIGAGGFGHALRLFVGHVPVAEQRR